MPGWPEYSISSLGRVRSKARVVYRSNGSRHSVRSMILSIAPCNGHPAVSVLRPGQYGRLYINPLMRELFPSFNHDDTNGDKN